jgi:hypothetical protein
VEFEQAVTVALRPDCRSIPAAKFRHSAELNGATRAALNSTLNELRTQRRSRRKRADRECSFASPEKKLANHLEKEQMFRSQRISISVRRQHG